MDTPRTTNNAIQFPQTFQAGRMVSVSMVKIVGLHTSTQIDFTSSLMDLASTAMSARIITINKKWFDARASSLLEENM